MEFKIRCSAIGQIMANGRGKDTMGKTAHTFCETWLKEKLYSSRKEFSTKQMEKGNIMEDESIDFIAEQLHYGFLSKNETHFNNDFMQGTPDVITKNDIIDVKNSWDCFTFPLFEKDIPNKSYWWQLQGYMELTGKRKAKLIYVLSDTPYNLIEKEAYYWCKNNGYEDLDMDIYKKFLERMTYQNVNPELKIKVFSFEYDPNAILAIKNRVIQCREYIDTLKTNIL